MSQLRRYNIDTTNHGCKTSRKKVLIFTKCIVARGYTTLRLRCALPLYTSAVKMLAILGQFYRYFYLSSYLLTRPDHCELPTKDCILAIKIGFEKYIGGR